MMNKIDYKIPSWKKVDLHIRSLASLNTIDEHEIKKYLAERKISLEEIKKDLYFCDYWVDDLVNVIRKISLNIISITNHNWFSKNTI